MIDWKNRYRIWVKTIAMVVVCLFTINTISWAYPGGRVSANNTNLQVQSLFKPMLDVTGETNDLQLRFETAIITKMISENNEIPCQNIDAALNDWYYNIQNSKTNPFFDTGRKLRVISSTPEKARRGGGVSVVVELRDGPGKGKRFKISSKCGVVTKTEVVKDIQKDASKVKVEAVNDGKKKGQIGNRAEVIKCIEENGEKYLVVRAYGTTKKIKLKKIDSSGIRKNLNVNTKKLLGDGAPRHYHDIANHIAVGYLAHLPDLYTFPRLFMDFFGYASPEDNMLAIHESLLDNPVSFFHEMGEYLVKKGDLKLSMEEGGRNLLIEINGSKNYITLLDSTLEYIERKMHWKEEEWTKDPHYLLRALQIQLFGERDTELTRRIRMEQARDELFERYYPLFKLWGLELKDVKIVSGAEQIASFSDGVLYLSREKFSRDAWMGYNFLNQEATEYLLSYIIFPKYLSQHKGEPNVVVYYLSRYLYEHYRQFNKQGVEDNENILQFNNPAESIEKFLRAKDGMDGNGNIAIGIRKWLTMHMVDLLKGTSIWQGRLAVTKEDVVEAIRGTEYENSKVAKRFILKLAYRNLVLFNSDKKIFDIRDSVRDMLRQGMIALLGWNYDESDECWEIAELLKDYLREKERTQGFDNFRNEVHSIKMPEIHRKWESEVEVDEKNEQGKEEADKESADTEKDAPEEDAPDKKTISPEILNEREQEKPSIAESVNGYEEEGDDGVSGSWGMFSGTKSGKEAPEEIVYELDETKFDQALESIRSAMEELRTKELTENEKLTIFVREVLAKYLVAMSVITASRAIRMQEGGKVGPADRDQERFEELYGLVTSAIKLKTDNGDLVLGKDANGFKKLLRRLFREAADIGGINKALFHRIRKCRYLIDNNIHINLETVRRSLDGTSQDVKTPFLSMVSHRIKSKRFIDSELEKRLPIYYLGDRVDTIDSDMSFLGFTYWGEMHGVVVSDVLSRHTYHRILPAITGKPVEGSHEINALIKKALLLDFGAVDENDTEKVEKVQRTVENSIAIHELNHTIYQETFSIRARNRIQTESMSYLASIWRGTRKSTTGDYDLKTPFSYALDYSSGDIVEEDQFDAPFSDLLNILGLYISGPSLFDPEGFYYNCSRVNVELLCETLGIDRRGNASPKDRLWNATEILKALLKDSMTDLEKKANLKQVAHSLWNYIRDNGDVIQWREAKEKEEKEDDEGGERGHVSSGETKKEVTIKPFEVKEDKEEDSKPKSEDSKPESKKDAEDSESDSKKDDEDNKPEDKNDVDGSEPEVEKDEERKKISIGDVLVNFCKVCFSGVITAFHLVILVFIFLSAYFNIFTIILSGGFVSSLLYWYKLIFTPDAKNFIESMDPKTSDDTEKKDDSEWDEETPISFVGATLLYWYKLIFTPDAKNSIESMDPKASDDTEKKDDSEWDEETPSSFVGATTLNIKGIATVAGLIIGTCFGFPGLGLGIGLLIDFRVALSKLLPTKRSYRVLSMGAVAVFLLVISLLEKAITTKGEIRIAKRDQNAWQDKSRKDLEGKITVAPSGDLENENEKTHESTEGNLPEKGQEPPEKTKLPDGTVLVSGNVPHQRQTNRASCVPAVLTMVYRYYGFPAFEEDFFGSYFEIRPRAVSGSTGGDVSLSNLRRDGFEAERVMIRDKEGLVEFLEECMKKGSLVMAVQDPFLMSRKRAAMNTTLHVRLVVGMDKEGVLINDPEEYKTIKWSWDHFYAHWHGRKCELIRVIPKKWPTISATMGKDAEKAIERLAQLLDTTELGDFHKGKILASISRKNSPEEIVESFIELSENLEKAGIKEYTGRVLSSLSRAKNLKDRLSELNRDDTAELFKSINSALSPCTNSLTGDVFSSLLSSEHDLGGFLNLLEKFKKSCKLYWHYWGKDQFMNFYHRERILRAAIMRSDGKEVLKKASDPETFKAILKLSFLIEKRSTLISAADIVVRILETMQGKDIIKLSEFIEKNKGMHRHRGGMISSTLDIMDTEKTGEMTEFLDRLLNILDYLKSLDLAEDKEDSLSTSEDKIINEFFSSLKRHRDYFELVRALSNLAEELKAANMGQDCAKSIFPTLTMESIENVNRVTAAKDKLNSLYKDLMAVGIKKTYVMGIIKYFVLNDNVNCEENIERFYGPSVAEAFNNLVAALEEIGIEQDDVIISYLRRICLDSNDIRKTADLSAKLISGLKKENVSVSVINHIFEELLNSWDFKENKVNTKIEEILEGGLAKEFANIALNFEEEGLGFELREHLEVLIRGESITERTRILASRKGSLMSSLEKLRALCDENKLMENMVVGRLFRQFILKENLDETLESIKRLLRVLETLDNIKSAANLNSGEDLDVIFESYLKSDNPEAFLETVTRLADFYKEYEVKASKAIDVIAIVMKKANYVETSLTLIDLRRLLEKKRCGKSLILKILREISLESKALDKIKNLLQDPDILDLAIRFKNKLKEEEGFGGSKEGIISCIVCRDDVKTRLIALLNLSDALNKSNLESSYKQTILKSAALRHLQEIRGLSRPYALRTINLLIGKLHELGIEKSEIEFCFLLKARWEGNFPKAIMEFVNNTGVESCEKMLEAVSIDKDRDDTIFVRVSQAFDSPTTRNIYIPTAKKRTKETPIEKLLDVHIDETYDSPVVGDEGDVVDYVKRVAPVSDQKDPSLHKHSDKIVDGAKRYLIDIFHSMGANKENAHYYLLALAVLPLAGIAISIYLATYFFRNKKKKQATPKNKDTSSKAVTDSIEKSKLSTRRDEDNTDQKDSTTNKNMNLLVPIGALFLAYWARSMLADREKTSADLRETTDSFVDDIIVENYTQEEWEGLPDKEKRYVMFRIQSELVRRSDELTRALTMTEQDRKKEEEYHARFVASAESKARANLRREVARALIGWYPADETAVDKGGWADEGVSSSAGSTTLNMKGIATIAGLIIGTCFGFPGLGLGVGLLIDFRTPVLKRVLPKLLGPVLLAYIDVFKNIEKTIEISGNKIRIAAGNEEELEDFIKMVREVLSILPEDHVKEIKTISKVPRRALCGAVGMYDGFTGSIYVAETDKTVLDFIENVLLHEIGHRIFATKLSFWERLRWKYSYWKKRMGGIFKGSFKSAYEYREGSEGFANMYAEIAIFYAAKEKKQQEEDRVAQLVYIQSKLSLLSEPKDKLMQFEGLFGRPLFEKPTIELEKGKTAEWADETPSRSSAGATIMNMKGIATVAGLLIGAYFSFPFLGLGIGLSAEFIPLIIRKLTGQGARTSLNTTEGKRSGEKLVADVEPIMEDHITPKSREDLAKVVEEPLLEACQIFFDKGIDTHMSSANRYNASTRGFDAYITGWYDRLSSENKAIIDGIIENGGKFEGARVEKFTGTGHFIGEGFGIYIPVNKNSTVREVSEVAVKFANLFKTQKETEQADKKSSEIDSQANVPRSPETVAKAKEFSRAVQEAMGLKIITLLMGLAAEDLSLDEMVVHYDEKRELYVLADGAVNVLGSMMNIGDTGACFNIATPSGKRLICMKETIYGRLSKGDEGLELLVEHERGHTVFGRAHEGKKVDPQKEIDLYILDELYAFFSSYLKVYGTERDLEHFMRHLEAMKVSILNTYINRMYSHLLSNAEHKFAVIVKTVIAFQLLLDAVQFEKEGIIKADLIAEYLLTADSLDQVVMIRKEKRYRECYGKAAEVYKKAKDREKIFPGVNIEAIDPMSLVDGPEGLAARFNEFKAKYEERTKAESDKEKKEGSANEPGEELSPIGQVLYFINGEWILLRRDIRNTLKLTLSIANKLNLSEKSIELLRSATLKHEQCDRNEDIRRKLFLTDEDGKPDYGHRDFDFMLTEDIEAIWPDISYDELLLVQYRNCLTRFKEDKASGAIDESRLSIVSIDEIEFLLHTAAVSDDFETAMDATKKSARGKVDASGKVIMESFGEAINWVEQKYLDGRMTDRRPLGAMIELLRESNKEVMEAIIDLRSPRDYRDPSSDKPIYAQPLTDEDREFQREGDNAQLSESTTTIAKSGSIARLVDDVSGGAYVLGRARVDKEGWFTTAYIPEDKDLNLVVKVPKPNHHLPKFLENYELAKENLGGIVARTILLKDVNFVINGELMHFDFAFVQEKVTPLREVLPRVPLEEAKRILDEVFSILRETHRRGMVNTDDKILRAYGIDRNGKVVLFDFSHIDDNISEIYDRYYPIYESEEVEKISPELKKYFEDNVIHIPEIESLWDKGLDSREAMEDPDLSQLPIAEEARRSEEAKKELTPREIRIMKNSLRKSCTRSVNLMENIEPVLDKLIKLQEEAKKDVPVDIEVDLSLITRENMEEYAEMWAYLILACRKYKNINFIFSTVDYPGKESQENPVTYEEFRELLAGEVKMKSSIFCKAGEVEDIMNNRIKNTTDETREGLVRIPIWSREYLTWMSITDVNLLKENQYPVALDEPIETRVGTALRNFEAALAIGLCKAALVLARRRDQETGENKELTGILEDEELDIVKKLENLYKIFNEKITINEDTLMYMTSFSPRTRIELAIYHALPPIVRMPIDMLQEEIKLANLYLQQA